MSYNFNLDVKNLKTEIKRSTTLDREIEVVTGIIWNLTIDNGDYFMTETYTTVCEPNPDQYLTTSRDSHDESYTYPRDVYVTYEDIAYDHTTEWLEALIDYAAVRAELQTKFETKLSSNVKSAKRICPWQLGEEGEYALKFEWDEELNMWVEKKV